MVTQKIVKTNASGKVIQQGYMVAVKNEKNEVGIGFSLCYKKDKYNKELGFNIALHRANQFKAHKIPQSILADVTYFVERCKKYYKDTEKLVV